MWPTEDGVMLTGLSDVSLERYEQNATSVGPMNQCSVYWSTGTDEMKAVKGWN